MVGLDPRVGSPGRKGVDKPGIGVAVFNWLHCGLYGGVEHCFTVPFRRSYGNIGSPGRVRDYLAAVARKQQNHFSHLQNH